MYADLMAQVAHLLDDGGQKRPPLHLWHPPVSGDIDIHITRDGRWFHEGSEFRREALVCLFASILRREGDEFFLVTPVEKWRLRVDGFPFVAIACDVVGSGEEQQLVFTTNVGDRVHCNQAHPLRMLPANGSATSVPVAETVPCVTVRDGLEARLARSVYYRLAEMVTTVDGHEGLWSGGHFFPLSGH